VRGHFVCGHCRSLACLLLSDRSQCRRHAVCGPHWSAARHRLDDGHARLRSWLLPQRAARYSYGSNDRRYLWCSANPHVPAPLDHPSRQKQSTCRGVLRQTRIGARNRTGTTKLIVVVLQGPQLLYKVSCRGLLLRRPFLQLYLSLKNFRGAPCPNQRMKNSKPASRSSKKKKEPSAAARSIFA